MNVKIGLEIHQRIAGKKLFCNCKAEYEEKAPSSITVTRQLHPVYSELGEIDRAAMEEALRERTFVYHYSPENCCLVELDEEPPHNVNEEALSFALEMALRMKMKIFPRIFVMRKIVIDGSNVSGFQRTMLVGVGGYVSSSQGNVGIQTLCLEEESAGIVGKDEFRLDRLGIPLVEISTAPEIKDGLHAKEVAEKIGLMLRATGKVMRGIGSIRQDLNVSVEGGARVEIKGAQDLNMIPKWVDNEIERQRKLLTIIRELKNRGAYEKLEFSPVDITRDIDVEGGFLKKIISSGGKVLALKLSGFGGLLGVEISPQRRFGSELSDYAKKAGVGGIIHSDEDPEKYKINNWQGIAKMLGCSEEDAFVIVAGREDIARRALERVFYRAKMDYVPEETRKTLPNGSTAYLRPLPGKARMYPETDIPPVDVSPEMLKGIKERMGEGYEEKRMRFMGVVGNKDLVEKLLRSRELPLFEKLLARGFDGKLSAVIVADKLREWRREGYSVTEEAIIRGLELYKKGKLTKRGVEEAIKMFAEGKSEEEVLGKVGRITGEELLKIVRGEKGNIKEIMRKYGTRIDGKELVAILKKLRA